MITSTIDNRDVYSLCQYRGVVTPIATVLRAVTRIVTPHTVHAGVVTVRLTAFLHILQKVTVTTDFCHGHRVTSSLAAWSCSHGLFSDGHMVTHSVMGCFQMVTGSDTSHRSKYGTHWSGHTLSVNDVAT